jgi:hypothetical protein
LFLLVEENYSHTRGEKQPLILQKKEGHDSQNILHLEKNGGANIHLEKIVKLPAKKHKVCKKERFCLLKR